MGERQSTLRQRGGRGRGGSGGRSRGGTDGGKQLPPKIPVYKYNKQKATWDEVRVLQESNKTQIHSSITAVTYNVCFEEDFWEQRFDQLLKELESNNVDIICLQEVRQVFVNKLLEQKWIQQGYYLSNTDQSGNIQHHTCILISRFLPSSMRRWSLPSTMDRDCLVADYLINGETFSIATTHLESLNNAYQRRRQLSSIWEIYSRNFSVSVNIMILGDFNFDSTRNFSCVLFQREEIKRGISIDHIDEINTTDVDTEPLENENIKSIFPIFKDVWEECKSGDKGYTYDSVKNPMIKMYERMRYDRILLKPSETWDAKDISLIGTQRVDPAKVGGAVVYPSDHFGLIVTLESKLASNNS